MREETPTRKSARIAALTSPSVRPQYFGPISLWVCVPQSVSVLCSTVTQESFTKAVTMSSAHAGFLSL